MQCEINGNQYAQLVDGTNFITSLAKKARTNKSTLLDRYIKHTMITSIIYIRTLFCVRYNGEHHVKSSQLHRNSRVLLHSI